MGAAKVRIEVDGRIPDRRLEKRAAAARAYLGVPLEALEETQVYKVEAEKPSKEALAGLFADPILQIVRMEDGAPAFRRGEPAFVADISYRPGVTDNSARAAAEALALAGIEAEVASGSLYFMFGGIDKPAAARVARELLANELIQK